MPDDASSCLNLGLLYGDYLKDNQKALEYYRKYLELAPRARDAGKIKEKISEFEKQLPKE